MASNSPVVITAAQLTTSAATYYTVPTGVTAYIRKLSLLNSTGGAVTATVHLVPNGGTANATNMVISAQSIAAGASYQCPEVEGQALAAGATIQALASAGTAISLRGTALEMVL